LRSICDWHYGCVFAYISHTLPENVYTAGIETAMSYIIAFVEYSPGGDVYPVECLRTDVDVGDAVIVHQPNRRLTPATVVQIRYLSWNCGGQIKGKVSEAEQGEDGFWSLRNCPSVVGLVTNDAFVAELKLQGWVPLKRGHIHMAALTNSNQTLSANILVRRNGIDLQILPTKRNALPRPFELSQESITEGRVVRHHFAHTTFNLYEGILRFATSFMSDDGNYDRFFTSVGSSDRRTEKQKQDAEVRRRTPVEREPDGLSDYYDMVSDGSGEPVYGGDGMWIGAGGSLHDWGR
jgi:hypothetical protein